MTVQQLDTTGKGTALTAPLLAANERKPLRRASVLSAFSAMLWVPQAWFLADAVHGLIFAGRPLEALLPLMAGFLAVALLAWGLDTLSGREASKGTRAAQDRLRAALSQKALQWSPFDKTRPASGEIAAALTDHIDILGPYLMRYGPTRARLMTVPLVILAVVFSVTWIGALGLALAGPLIPVFMALIGMKAKDASARQLAEIGTMNALLLDRLQGLDTIRAFDAVGLTASQLKTRAFDLKVRTMEVLQIAFLSSAVLELFSALGVALMAVYVGFSLLGEVDIGHWGASLTLREGLFVLLLAPEFFQPLRDFAAVYHDKAAGEAAREVLRGLQERQGAMMLGTGGAGTRPAVHAAPALHLDAVSFAYEGGAAVVDGFSLQLAPGEKVALVGESGAGKSTLLALAAGLVHPQGGTVRVDGAALDDAHADDWRSRLAWIGQKPHIFHASFQANLFMGGARPDSGSEALLRRAALKGLVERLPRGMIAPLGEAGLTLSGGEVRRIALARALAREPALILADEPTESLDQETAARIIEALFDRTRPCTLLVATHDPAVMTRADRVIRLDGPDRPEGPARPEGQEGQA